jgi:putative transposase
VKSFNGRLHQECMNANWFLSLEDAKMKIEAWRRDYSEARPHSLMATQIPPSVATSNSPT